MHKFQQLITFSIHITDVQLTYNKYFIIIQRLDGLFYEVTQHCLSNTVLLVTA